MDFMKEIAPQLELCNSFLEEWDNFLENNVEHVRYRLESRCPEFRRVIRARRQLEKDIFQENAELYDKYFLLQTETDNATIKAAFLLGIKAGIKLNQT